MGHGGKHMMGHGGKHMMPGGGMYKRMEKGGKAKNRLMQYMASGGMMPMDPKMAKHGMKVTSGGVMIKIMPMDMEEGGMVQKMTHGGYHSPEETMAMSSKKEKIERPTRTKSNTSTAVQKTSSVGFDKTKTRPGSRELDPEGKPGRFQQIAARKRPLGLGSTFIADATTTGSEKGKMSFTQIRPGIGTRGSGVSTTITPEGLKVKQRGEKPMTSKQLSEKSASRKRGRIKKRLIRTLKEAERQGRSTQIEQPPTGQLGSVLPAQTARKENIEKAERRGKRRGNKGLKALAAKNPQLKYIGKDGMKMPGGGHVMRKR